MSSATYTITVNPWPDIVCSGTPLLNQNVAFYDLYKDDYATSSISAVRWDYGDGSVIVSATSTSGTYIHSYSSVGLFNVILRVYDISGASAMDSTTVGVLASNDQIEEDYITICGPEDLSRYGANKRIDITQYLPQYLKDGETDVFLTLFEDFLNNMFGGREGWITSANTLPITQNWSIDNVNTTSAIVNTDFTYGICAISSVPTDSTDAEQIEIHWPPTAQYATSAQKISILEKVNRLTELHDPDLIDIEYIQFFAKNLGYNIDVNRNEIGVSGDVGAFGLTEFGGNCSESDINKYLRFVVSNLPTWYKIKTTRNAIKVMLYSFGLVGDIIEFFTDSYKEQALGGKWTMDFDGNLAAIPNSYFPTPHFAIKVDIDASSDISFDISRRFKVIKAIESIRPVNDVFRRLVGYFKRTIDVYVGGVMRFTRYIEIKPTNWANYQYGSAPTYINTRN